MEELKEPTLLKKGPLAKKPGCSIKGIKTEQNTEESGHLNGRDNFYDKTKGNVLKRPDGLRDKVFQPRESLLTELLQIKHFSTIYNLFGSFLFLHILESVLIDIVKFQIPNLKEFDLIAWNFQGLFTTGLLIWLGMQSSTFLFYYFYRIWGLRRINLILGAQNIKIWDKTFLNLALIYQVTFLIVPPWLIMQHNISIALSAALLMEQIRFMMKTYSFVRINATKVSGAKSSEKISNVIPSFQKYVYFLFAPTLIYKDEYPRTNRISWRRVIGHFTNFFVAIFYLAFLVEYVAPTGRNFGKEKLTFEKILSTIIRNCFLYNLMFHISVYVILHLWQNAFAEMLCFADKMFYQDWWNSCSTKEFWQKWNTIVNDWIYVFLYKETITNMKTKKSTSTWIVFLISGLFHEYVLTFTLKFCYPIFFIQYGFINSLAHFFPKLNVPVNGNFVLWICFLFPYGILISLYGMEYYARINCPSSAESPIEDFFTPRSWTCLMQLYSS